MKLKSINEYGFAKGASLDPKRDEQVQFNRHKAASAPAAAPVSHKRTPTGDDEYDEDMEYDDVTESMWHLRELTGNMVSIMDVAEFTGMDPNEIVDIANRLEAKGRMQGRVDNGVETILDYDDLRPLLTHIFGIL